MLGDRLQEVEDALAEVRGEKRQLEMTVGELRSDIAHSREELATAATIQSDLSGEVSVLAGQLQDAGGRRDGTTREVEGRHGALGMAEVGRRAGRGRGGPYGEHPGGAEGGQK